MKNYLVIDVESIGLHGEGFAVAGVYLEKGKIKWEFCFSCPRSLCFGDADDRKWVGENVPELPITHKSSWNMREAFWEMWLLAKKSGALLAADCAWPVEAKFLRDCVSQDLANRKFNGPYPFVEISTVVSAAGFDPMIDYPREDCELPKHNPLMDARQSARLLLKSLEVLDNYANNP